jgi:nucleoside-triphosphatase THEP1
MFTEPKIFCTFVKINDMKKNIIGISGKIGSGKDTFAELLAEQLQGKVERHALADKLRIITEIVSGIRMTTTHEVNKPFCNEIRNYTQDQKNILIKQFNKTIGETLQLVGTDLFRDNYDTDIWVKSFFNEELEEKLNEGKIIIVPESIGADDTIKTYEQCITESLKLIREALDQK